MLELICLVFLSCPVEPIFEELMAVPVGACYSGASYYASFSLCSVGYQSQDIKEMLED